MEKGNYNPLTFINFCIIIKLLSFWKLLTKSFLTPPLSLFLQNINLNSFIMKKILLLLSVLLSTMTYAQGHETFDNLELTGNSYTSGSFVGQDGVTWTFGEARGDLELNGAAITLGRNRENPMFLESETIATGIGTLEFSYIQAFTANVGVEVLVNGELVYTATSDDENGVVKSSGLISVDVEGDVVITFNNPATFGQVTIDDIIWTPGEIVGIDDNNTVGFNFFPNPANDVLNISAKIAIESVDAFNVLGQKVINNSHFNNGQVNVANLPAGSYLFQVKFENGTQQSFNILKQ